MSFDAMSWAVKQNCATPTAKLILLLIANYADEKHSAFPSKDHLAKQANCDERTIRRALRSLEDQGLISVEQRHDANGKQSSNRYILSLDKLSRAKYSKETQINKKQQDRKVPHQKAGGDIFEGVGVTNMPPNTIRTIQSNNKYTPEFESWWSIYPRRDGSKRKAFDLWKNVVKEFSHEKLYSITNQYALSRKGEDPKFTPHATTWLNQRRFETVQPVTSKKNLNSLAG